MPTSLSFFTTGNPEKDFFCIKRQTLSTSSSGEHATTSLDIILETELASFSGLILMTASMKFSRPKTPF